MAGETETKTGTSYENTLARAGFGVARPSRHNARGSARRPPGKGREDRVSNRQAGAARDGPGRRSDARARLPPLGAVPRGGEPGRRNTVAGGRGGLEGLHTLVRGLGSGRLGPSHGPPGPRGAPTGLPHNLRKRAGLRRLLGRGAEPHERVPGRRHKLLARAGPRAGTGGGTGGQDRPRVGRPLVRPLGGLTPSSSRGSCPPCPST